MRAADGRFVLAEPVRRAAAIGDVGAWADGLEAAGIEVCSIDDRDLDLVITPAARTAEAITADPRAVIAIGRASTRWPGRHARRFLVRMAGSAPRVIVPLGDRAAVAAGLRTSVADTTIRRAVRAGTLAAAGRGFAPPSATRTVIQRNDDLPYVIRAARELGATPIRTWALQLGDGDDLQRAVFHLIPEGADTPAWVVKFAHVPGHDGPFDDDERALDTLRRRAPRAAANAPSILGRRTVAGLPLSLETAASGQPMNEVLSTNGPTPEMLALVDRVAEWAIALGTESGEPAGELAAERHRLRTEVASSRAHPGVADAIAVLDGTDDIPAVVQHNDLGTWNILTDGAAFTVLDWESSSPTGLPLWDLVYFLADALTAIDGTTSNDTTVERMVALFRGESALSPVLFRHLRIAVDVLGLAPAAVGPIVTMCWAHHSRSFAFRQEALAASGGDPVGQRPLGRLAAAWLDDPLLGPGWNRWQ